MDEKTWEALYSRLGRIEDHADETSKSLNEIKVILTQQHTVLDEHIRRTEAAEDGIKLLQAEMKPLETHVAVVGAFGKVIAVVGTIVGIVTGLLSVFH
jgi:hypothetical protein